MVRELNNQSPEVPESIATARRNEIDNAQMNIIGTLPEDLHGYVFMVAPALTIDSEEPYSKDGNTFLNGDGMIYRFDFSQPGQVTIKTKIVEPPDFILDREIENNREFPLRDLVKFRNHGIARFSYLLGSRNLLNTAFLPVKFAGDSGERLLVTYDAGRPYEIDLETLSLISPVGQNNEWRSAIPLLNYLFGIFLTTAHPAFDPKTQQMFTVNYGRDLSNFLGTEEGKKYQQLINTQVNTQINSNQDSNSNNLLQFLLRKLIPSIDSDFVYLISWDSKSFQKWELIDEDGSPIEIKQSIHQIGVTKDYVVLLDTSFTVGLEQILNLPLPEIKELEARIRKLLTLKPLPDSNFYIVKRQDLKPEADSIVAKKIEIPREACHFLVDYENANDRITLHVAHICAWHVGEWIRDFDVSPYDNEILPTKIHGMQQSAMDISKMGRYVVDVSDSEPKIADEKLIFDDKNTWGAGLFAYLDRLPSSGITPKKIENIYWISYGLWEDLTTDFMYELYKEYKYREKDLDEVLKLAKKGIPATLFRLDTSSNESFSIVDSFQFTPGHIVLSPQFVPRKNGKENSVNGYIFCTVFTPKGDRIWIFDAENLNKGQGKPICELDLPELNFGLSLHTTWFEKISSHEPINEYSIREDYRELFENLSSFIKDNFFFVSDNEKDQLQEKIEGIFENKIYPQIQ